MDIRIEKTNRAIRETFLRLRARKPLEKITVKELCQEAQINKSTFYTHYEDIYALSAAIETEAVAHILSSISQSENYSAENPETFAREICMACISHLELTELLFSDQDNSRLANRLEEGIKNMIYQKYPEYREDREKTVLLSFCIQGAHHAYLNNRHMGSEELVQTIEKIIKTLQPLYHETSSR